jgi:putative aldouronate transport system substrate-binding protein
MPGSQVPYLEWGWSYDRDIAAELGIDPPKTLDDWIAAWRKVKAAKPDVVPLVSRKGELLPFMMMIYGIGSADGAPYTFRGGDLVSPWTDDRYREMVTMLHTLYDEELLWADFTNTAYEEVRTFAANHNAFSILDYLGAPFQLSEGRLAAVDAPVGPYGDTGHRWIGYTSYWGASISGQTDHLDEALAVWDYYYSPEGAELAIFGKEGVTFKRNADGSIDFLQKIKDEAADANLSVDQWLGKQYNVFIFHIGPSLNMGVREQILRGRALGESQDRLRSMYYIGSNLAPIAPPIWNTDEEINRLSELNADLNTFRDEWITKFIVGQEPLSKWDEYIAGMKRLGIDETIDIANAGYERYLNSVGESKGFIPPTNIDTTGLAQYVGL